MSSHWSSVVSASTRRRSTAKTVRAGALSSASCPHWPRASYSNSLDDLLDAADAGGREAKLQRTSLQRHTERWCRADGHTWQPAPGLRERVRRHIAVDTARPVPWRSSRLTWHALEEARPTLRTPRIAASTRMRLSNGTQHASRRSDLQLSDGERRRATVQERLLLGQENGEDEQVHMGSLLPGLGTRMPVSRARGAGRSSPCPPVQMVLYLHKVFRKFGITSRTQLDSALPPEPAAA